MDAWNVLFRFVQEHKKDPLGPSQNGTNKKYW